MVDIPPRDARKNAGPSGARATTTIGQVGQELARTNPSWRSPSWASQHQDLRAGNEQRPESLLWILGG
jgi:hypothetical protein